jgi:hypothetical protein
MKASGYEISSTLFHKHYSTLGATGGWGTKLSNYYVFFYIKIFHLSIRKVVENIFILCSTKSTSLMLISYSAYQPWRLIKYTDSKSIPPQP